MNMLLPSAEFRFRARQALRGNMPVAVMVAFLASLPSLIGSTLTTLFGTELSNTLNSYQLMILEGTLPDIMVMLNDFCAAMTPALMTALAVSLVLALFSPMLNLGLLNYLQNLLRGQAGTPSDVLSRKQCFLKAIGLDIWIALKTAVWMLPGLALYLLGVWAAVRMQSLSMLSFSAIAGIVTMTVLMVRASLHYAMSSYIMAESPDIGIRAAVCESIVIMRSRKLACFMLMLSFFGWTLLISVIAAALTAISPVIGLTGSMAMNLVLQIYVSTSACAFYQEYSAQEK